MKAVAPVAAAGTIALAAYLVLFDYRSDYAGHMLAGFGGTLAVLGAALALRGVAKPSLVVLATLGAIGLGALIEATIFKIAIFDPVDFAHQSLGACLGAAGVIDRRGHGTGLAYVVVGIVALGGGFHYAFA